MKTLNVNIPTAPSLRLRTGTYWNAVAWMSAWTAIGCGQPPGELHGARPPEASAGQRPEMAVERDEGGSATEGEACTDTTLRANFERHGAVDIEVGNWTGVVATAVRGVETAQCEVGETQEGCRSRLGISEGDLLLASGEAGFRAEVTIGDERRTVMVAGTAALDDELEALSERYPDQQVEMGPAEGVWLVTAPTACLVRMERRSARAPRVRARLTSAADALAIYADRPSGGVNVPDEPPRITMRCRADGELDDSFDPEQPCASILGRSSG